MTTSTITPAVLNTNGLEDQLGAAAEQLPTIADDFDITLKPPSNFYALFQRVAVLVTRAWNNFWEKSCKPLHEASEDVKRQIAEFSAELPNLLSQAREKIAMGMGTLKDEIATAADAEVDAIRQNADDIKAAMSDVASQRGKVTALRIGLTGRDDGRVDPLEDRHFKTRMGITALSILILEVVATLPIMRSATGSTDAAIAIMTIIAGAHMALGFWVAKTFAVITGFQNAKNNYRVHFPAGTDKAGKKVYLYPLNSTAKYGFLITAPTLAVLAIGNLAWRMWEVYNDPQLAGNLASALGLFFGTVAYTIVETLLSPRHTKEDRQHFYEHENLLRSLQLRVDDLKKALHGKDFFGESINRFLAVGQAAVDPIFDRMQQIESKTKVFSGLFDLYRTILTKVRERYEDLAADLVQIVFNKHRDIDSEPYGFDTESVWGRVRDVLDDLLNPESFTDAWDAMVAFKPDIPTNLVQTEFGSMIEEARTAARAKQEIADAKAAEKAARAAAKLTPRVVPVARRRSL